MGRWRAGIFLATVILGLASSLYYLSADQRQTPPDDLLKLPVKFDQEVFDLGQLSDLEPVEVELGFVWQGQTPTEVIKAVASCGCSQTHIDAEQLQPGQHAAISLHFNPAGFRGPVQKSVYLYLDQGEAKVQFQAQVVPSVMAEPSLINFGKIHKGQTVTRQTKVYFEGEVEKLELGSPFRGLTVSEQRIENKVNTLTLKLDTRFSETYLDGNLFLVTEKERRLLELKLFGEVVP